MDTEQKELKINKVKYDRKKLEVTIDYDILGNGTDDIKVVLKSADKPLDEFADSMNSLAEYVEIICDLKQGYCSMAEVRGVSFSWSNDVMGAVITALIPVETANSPVVINTPHLPSEDYSGNNENALVLPLGCVTRLKQVLVEAERYINGERTPDNQMSLDI